jgi:hypothetical protein
MIDDKLDNLCDPAKKARDRTNGRLSRAGFLFTNPL